MDNVYSLDEDVFLLGRMCAGKDWLANKLVADAGYTKVCFADALKNEVAEANGISRAELDRRKGEFRSELQKVGSDRRALDPSYWIKRWYRVRRDIPGPVVVADCRHRNEALFGARLGGLVVRVAVEEQVRRARIHELYGEVDEYLLHHESETEVDKCVHHVVAPGDLGDDAIEWLDCEVVQWRRKGQPLQQLHGTDLTVEEPDAPAYSHLTEMQQLHREQRLLARALQDEQIPARRAASLAAQTGMPSLLGRAVERLVGSVNQNGMVNLSAVHEAIWSIEKYRDQAQPVE